MDISKYNREEKIKYFITTVFFVIKSSYAIARPIPIHELPQPIHQTIVNIGYPMPQQPTHKIGEYTFPTIVKSTEVTKSAQQISDNSISFSFEKNDKIINELHTIRQDMPNLQQNSNSNTTLVWGPWGSEALLHETE